MPPSPSARGLLRWEVVRELALSDFRLKYYDSVLGYAWSMLSPLLMLAVFYFVFRFVVGVTTPGYLVYLLVGLVCWTFFQDCSYSGLTALASKAGVLKAVHVPAGLVVAAGILSTLITLAINTAVLVVVLGLAGRLSPLAPLALVPLLCLALLAAGTSFLVALAGVQFRDVALIWSVLLQAGFWLTPVVYVANTGPVAELLYFNPLARCLHLIRWFLLYDYLPTSRFVVLTVAACVGTFVLGVGLFLRRQATIPEGL
jgi:ABC-type polysaccharide/polyol phosphate export permease